MKKIIKNKGLIINIRDYQENAILANILKQDGKQTFIIRGAKKITSANHAFNNPLELIEFNATLTNGISTFTEGVILDNYNQIKEDQSRYNIAVIILEKVNYFAEQVSDNKILFNFVIDLLNLLKSTNYLKAVSLIFEIKLLYLLGVAPSFNRCPVCGKKAINGALVISSGGYLCQDCQFALTTSLNYIDSNLLKTIYMTKLINMKEDLLALINESESIENVVDEYYAYHLDFDSKVKKIIKKIG